MNQFFALLLLDNTSQIYKRKWRSEEVQTTLSYVEKTLTPIELFLNLEAILKFVPWKLKSAAPNELKTS